MQQLPHGAKERAKHKGDGIDDASCILLKATCTCSLSYLFHIFSRGNAVSFYDSKCHPSKVFSRRRRHLVMRGSTVFNFR